VQRFQEAHNSMKTRASLQTGVTCLPRLKVGNTHHRGSNWSYDLLPPPGPQPSFVLTSTVTVSVNVNKSIRHHNMAGSIPSTHTDLKTKTPRITNNFLRRRELHDAAKVTHCAILKSLFTLFNQADSKKCCGSRLATCSANTLNQAMEPY
jgi:hypothetical protein